MLFTFLNMAGQTLFIRDDAERAEWTTEELTLEVEFPLLPNKKVSIGQRVLFKDPATGASQIYEVRQAKTLQPDGYQQVIAEHICISELCNEHMDKKELKKKTISSALTTVLAGTQWHLGNCATNPKASLEISRGAVWSAVGQLKETYNVYIVPRVVLNSDGTISRYLDVEKSSGTWRGLRLSIDKNALDPSVTYDDSELYTALYGYGGTVTQSGGRETKEVTFEDEKWSKTADHPAKPKGQKYLEDPAATAAYGRNGRARFGYYQNSDITDPEELLEKTWEKLQTVSKPQISVDGTVADLYRMGYADQPLRLHDIALVEVAPSGFKMQLQIIRMTVDLLDPTATSVTIGSYVPNIIYYNKKTNDAAGGGGGGGGNTDPEENKWREFRTTINAYQDGTGMQIQAAQYAIDEQGQEIIAQSGRLEVLYNEITAEVKHRVDADNELAGRIQVQADKISLVVSETSHGAVINAAQIVASINNGSSSILISADHIDIEGLVTKLEAQTIGVGGLHVEGLAEFLRPAYFEASIACEERISCENLTVGSHGATWQQKQIQTLTMSAYHNFTYDGGSIRGRVITDVSVGTIYYLGR